MFRAIFVAALGCLAATEASAQLRVQEYVTGLTQPVALVQDPTDPTVQFAVEQGGRIRAVRSGAVQMDDFLTLTGAISSGGERGLLGLAFPPDYGFTRRFYVNFTDPAGHTVVARFLRSSADPLRADPASRFDLLWPTGERFIRQPFANHNGGDLAFGPDGYLYVPLGDGGSANDPDHRAQDLTTLLGKVLRIDVSVADTDPAGYRVPADNPFVGVAGALGEIWSVGLRNPWRVSFDAPALGGTGAMLIGDVGQSSWEEIDYQPPGQGGLNFGWRNREGAHDNVTSLPPAFLPLTDPIFEYDRTSGATVIGGFVYRGSALAASFRGRYFFADFVAGRVWSIALTIDPATGGATASDLREHTSELGGTATLGSISSFGVDTGGELYVLSWSRGVVLRILGPPAAAPLLFLDTPAGGARLDQPFQVGGWALDRSSTSGPGVDHIHVWAYPASGAPPIFVGATTTGGSRPDVGAVFGPQFATAGFGLSVTGLASGSYNLVTYGRVLATGAFDVARLVGVTIGTGARVVVDLPANNSTLMAPFRVAGWAIDTAASSGTGIDTIHVWAYPAAGGPPLFLGVPALGGSRPDVGAIFGSAFTPSGYNLSVSSLAPGTWDVVVYARSAVSLQFEAASVVRVTVQ